ncbi:putative enzyme related to lactoylglutathione lyase [Shimia isoporae]|uniref:Putative enzyme related to lactoylglutathione lyase n=1 Tax=Shimia isoporae TaxID=647720 RepID=A0A4R1N2L1_9RHOB|nr:VOC family protein [Shimia isoporae]TCL00458.1 putative enzyme related to lactoylglutathione lyase [Shimia isoporae]
MNRAFMNILADDVEKTANFYQNLLGMMRQGDFGWFILLSHKDLAGFELGILERQHDTLPESVPPTMGGAVLTFVVDDLSEVHDRACEMKADIVQTPTDLPYGQRRLMLQDPSGTFVDISSPIG